MPVPGLDPKRCATRNRVNARRYNAEATPIRFVGREQASLSALVAAAEVDEDSDLEAVDGEGRVEDGAEMDVVPANPGDAGHSGVEAPEGGVTHGELPLEEGEALAAINARLPKGAKRLEAADVYIHYVEAASNTFIGDRYAFLSEQTLRNIADGGAAGVAFMNSHKTGDMSHPSELPFGKTFAGQFQQFTDAEGRVVQRTILGFYMVRGQFPNGANGPSTDDLDSGIRGGTIFDVSVGLGGGKAVCNVCGNKVNSEECGHAPGTHYGMSEEEVEAQRARGVTEGRASYTIDGAKLGEVSAVYDGAVPGAGFRKSIALSANFSPAELSDVRQVYSALLGDTEDNTNMSESIIARFASAVKDGVRDALKEMGFGAKSEAEPGAADLSAGSAGEGAAEGEDLAVTGDPLTDSHLNHPEVEAQEKAERDAAAAGEGAEEAAAEVEAEAGVEAGAEAGNEIETAGADAEGGEGADVAEGGAEADAEVDAATADPATAAGEAEASADAGGDAAVPAGETVAEEVAAATSEAAAEVVVEAPAPVDPPVVEAPASADLSAGLPTTPEQLAAMLKEAAQAGATAAAEAFKPQIEELTGQVTDLSGKLANAVEVKKPSKVKLATDFLKLMKDEGRHIPADDKDFIRDYTQFAIDDELNPVTEGPSRVERFEASIRNRKQHGMFAEALDSEADRVLLANEAPTTTQAADRKAALLSATALGQSAQKAKK